MGGKRSRKMAITKYESYYLKILEKLKLIKADNEYKTDSIAFAHWYLVIFSFLDGSLYCIIVKALLLSSINIESIPRSPSPSIMASAISWVFNL